MTITRKKLIEVALPLEAINRASAREKSIRHGHPSTLHLWWARRPLAAARAVLFAQLTDDSSAYLNAVRTAKTSNREHLRLSHIISVDVRGGVRGLLDCSPSSHRLSPRVSRRRNERSPSSRSTSRAAASPSPYSKPDELTAAAAAASGDVATYRGHRTRMSLGASRALRLDQGLPLRRIRPCCPAKVPARATTV